jgi:thiamine biosynthesis lipoprotein ApbE
MAANRFHAGKSESRQILGFAAAASIGLLGVYANPAAAFAGSSGAALHTSAIALPVFSAAHESILGTSLDLFIQTNDQSDARRCEQTILTEISRLQAILSTYNPQSTISRFMRGAVVRSRELTELLKLYSTWQQQTGVIRSDLGGLVSIWKQAAKTGVLPSESMIADAMNQPMALNVDALGKGYIIDRCVELARHVAPAGLLNIGGDIRAWGEVTWNVGIANPHAPHDNAQPLTSFLLQNAAVATSGGYARFHAVDGKKYSHLIDPRTGWPVYHRTSATAIAADCVTANALSTSATILSPLLAKELLEEHSDGYLLADASGATHAGGLLQQHGTLDAPLVEQRTLIAMADPATSKPSTKAWPKDYQLSIDIALKDPNAPVAGAEPGGPRRGRGSGGYRRPYVAIWIEDAQHKVVRTINLWGNDPKWSHELSHWWQASKGAPRDTRSITRATRPAGKYTVAWDGNNDNGAPAPTGTYTVVVEINREHGRHVKETAVIECDQSPAATDLKASAESDASRIQFGPRAEQVPPAS